MPPPTARRRRVRPRSRRVGEAAQTLADAAGRPAEEAAGFHCARRTGFRRRGNRLAEKRAPPGSPRGHRLVARLERAREASSSGRTREPNEATRRALPEIDAEAAAEAPSSIQTGWKGRGAPPPALRGERPTFQPRAPRSPQRLRLIETGSEQPAEGRRRQARCLPRRGRCPDDGAPRGWRPSRCRGRVRAEPSQTRQGPLPRRGGAGRRGSRRAVRLTGCSEITNPAAPFGALGAIASGGELSRLALALKVALASRGGEQPVMIFDEVDQGVGGAVADAVGQRLKRLPARRSCWSSPIVHRSRRVLTALGA